MTFPDLFNNPPKKDKVAAPKVEVVKEAKPAKEVKEAKGKKPKEVEVEVTVTYNLTLQVPHDEDAESIVNDIDFESVSYNSDNITWLSASVDRIDF